MFWNKQIPIEKTEPAPIKMNACYVCKSAIARGNAYKVPVFLPGDGSSTLEKYIMKFSMISFISRYANSIPAGPVESGLASEDAFYRYYCHSHIPKADLILNGEERRLMPIKKK